MGQVQPQRPLLQQAPVAPLDASGFTASVVGTVLFALAAVVSAYFVGPGRWTNIFATGTGLGLILIPYTVWHRFFKQKKDAQKSEQPTESVED